jgi:hypothetical protein
MSSPMMTRILGFLAGVCAQAIPTSASSASAVIVAIGAVLLVSIVTSKRVVRDARYFWSNGNTRFQSRFMSTTVQPLAVASSSALSRRPTSDSRS